MSPPNEEKAPSAGKNESSLRSFLIKLKKRHIIETLAGFIAGGWLIIEFVDRILVAHWELNKKWIDVTFFSLLGTLIGTLIWRWFSGREKPRKFKLELVLIPLAAVLTVLLDINLLLHMKGPEPGTIPSSRWKNSIAVLPFVDMSPQKDQEYFCDGMTEELINRLSNIRELKVPARTSVFMLRGKAQDLQEVGQKLKVKMVLEGSVRKAGNELRITAQLVNIGDGYHLWSETFDRPLQDIFTLQDEISLQIINKLKIELLGEERARVVKRYTDSAEANDLYMRGMWIRNNKLTEEEFRKAIFSFEEAIKTDPNFSLAYVGLAGAQLDLSFWHFASADETIPKAKKALEQALRIDPDLPEALAESGLIKYNFEYDWPGGESDIKRALELNPNCGTAHVNQGDLLLTTGKTDKAIEEYSEALALDPLSLDRQGGFALRLYLAGRYDDAIRQCRKTLELDSEYPFALANLGLCYVQKSQFAEAIATLQNAVALSGKSSEFLSYLTLAYAMSGDIEKAHQELAELDNLAKSVYVSKFYLAAVYAAMGNTDRAFELLELAYKERDANLIDLKTDPQFAVLRSDPRYEMMLKKIGLRK